MTLSRDYISGLFDGEGTIGIYRNKGCADTRYKSGFKSPSWILFVGISGAYAPMMHELKKAMGGRISPVKFGKGANKPTYNWVVGSKADIRRVLIYLLPSLNEKKSQASLMLKAVNGRMSMEAAAKALRKEKRRKFYV